jgi:hexulose-6-phosphate isomerase
MTAMDGATTAGPNGPDSVQLPRLGIYEKALPREVSWRQRLTMAREAQFDFVEISVDESDERLARLEWTATERQELVRDIQDTGVSLASMCLSAHRRFPLGSPDEKTRQRALTIGRQAIDLAADLGVRVVQLAGYDVYYQPSTDVTRSFFLDGLQEMTAWAAQRQVMLGMEIMDYPLMNSISKYLPYRDAINSPWFRLYPDVGNLSAWDNDVLAELELGRADMVGIHLKDTLAVTPEFEGQFRDVPFGQGCVDFASVFAKLAELSYCGPFLVEMWTEKSAEPLVEIRKARAWLLEQMREGGFIS